jgi:hypothetical protein
MFKFVGGTMTAADLEEHVAEMRAASLKPIQGAEPDFGQRLKAATQRRLGKRITANASADGGEDYGQKLKQAVQRHPKSKEQTQKSAEKQRSRYHPPQRRKATKSD